MNIFQLFYPPLHNLWFAKVFFHQKYIPCFNCKTHGKSFFCEGVLYTLCKQAKENQSRSPRYPFLCSRLLKEHTASTKTEFRSISVDHLHCLLMLVYQCFKDLSNQNYTEHLQNKIANRNFLCGLIVSLLLTPEVGSNSFFHL